MPVIVADRARRLSTRIRSRAGSGVRARLREESGFTMMMTLFVLFAASLLTAVAIKSATDDVVYVRSDLDQKKAYYAAQAGINDYAFHLNEDVNYWTYCTTVPTPNAVNQKGSTANRRTVAGVSDESYAIQLLPASSYSSCDVANPIASMIESTGPAAGTFRISSTGYSGKAQRTIVATFKRKSFLNFVYYTVYETSDPSTYTSASDRTAAATACNIFWRQGRQPPSGTRNYCTQIFFTTGDTVNGPLHTEDELAVCGSPTFGRDPTKYPTDAVEVEAGSPGYSNQGNTSCGLPNPKFNTANGKLTTNASAVSMPPTNAQLKQIALPAYSFTGQTHITLNNSNGTDTMTVYNNGTTKTMPFPGNGVVYVSSGTCSTIYTPFNLTYSKFTTSSGTYPYSGGLGCGNVTVDGSFGTPLTIATDADILIDGNLAGGALLGLVAQDFVRVYHPCNSSQGNLTGSMTSPTIDAAILAVTGSFMVDNYNCGAQLGQLNVTGAIAQKFRGAVGTIGSTGYLKNYWYNDALKEEEPPHFLNPVQASWQIQRETLCGVGTAAC